MKHVAAAPALLSHFAFSLFRKPMRKGRVHTRW